MGTDFNYDDADHQAIFDAINGGVRSGPLQEASRAWQQLGHDIGATGKSYVQGAISGILTSREGAAAAAAAAATGAMLPWMEDVARITTIAAQRAQSQADYWVTAQHNVPPVPPAPQSTGFLSDPTEWAAERMDWFPGVTSDREQAEKHRQDAAEQARQAMRVYQSSSNGNIDPGPVFTAPQALDGSIGGLPLTNPHVGSATAPPTMGGGGAGAHQAHLLATHQPAASHPAAYQPAATVSQLAQGGHAGTAGSGAPAPGRWGGNPGQGGTPRALPVGTGFGDSTAGRGPAKPSTVRGGATAARYGGARGGTGHTAGFSPRPSAGFGPRPALSTHPSIDDMSGTPAGTGSAAGTRTASGTSYGKPFATGTSQRGEQDREHRSKYLVPGDSNAIVGDLPPTAPPVIGEDPDY